MNKDIESILFTEAEIKEKVRGIGAQITKDFAGKKPVLVGVLKGATCSFPIWPDALT